MGGTEKFIMNIYKYIDKKKFSFDFYILNPQFISQYEEEITSYGGRIIKGKSFGLGKIKSGFKALYDAIRLYGPYDVVHSHVNLGNAYVLYTAKKAGIKIRISHSHAVFCFSKQMHRKIQEHILRHILLKSATAFCACSKEASISLYGKTKDKNVVVINNGIEIEKFLRDAESLNSDYYANLCGNNKYIWGNITRFDNNKNQEFILKCFKCFLEYEPKSMLILGGVDGGQRDTVQKKAKELKIDSKILFIGTQTNVEQWLTIIDVFIFPSKHEGFGIALIEAQIAGCNCFASTGVPLSTDLGLGNVYYYDLNDGEEEWAKKIYYQVKKFQRPKTADILNRVHHRKLSAQDATRQMEILYEEKE